LRTFGIALLFGAVLTPTTPAAAAPAWNLVWQDDFNGEADTPPDPAYWTAQVGGDGWGNNELQYYTDSTGNAAQNGQGQLVITARKEEPAGSTCWYGPCQYSSARLTTKDKYAPQYGKIESRMKLPAGQGMWPAFWMMGSDFDSTSWPNCGEIDIMENVGNEPDTVYGTIHGPGYSDANGPSGSTRNPDGTPLSDAFHTYSIEWLPDSITWSIDNTPYFTATPSSIPADKRWVFDHSFFMILNLAVGGAWPGSPDASTGFPQQLTVDYVRVYSAA
jgi:beta-glucanase (GH16 family)